MYRAYQPHTPASSLILRRRWDNRAYDLHRETLLKIKHSIDDESPKTYVHLHIKLKPLQVQEERLAAIERDNRILLEKMAQIMRTTGAVDNKNVYRAKSLNKLKRQQEILKISHENRAVLKRILTKQPHYRKKEWERDYTIHRKHVDMMQRYPPNWWQLKNDGFPGSNYSGKLTKRTSNGRERHTVEQSRFSISNLANE